MLGANKPGGSFHRIEPTLRTLSLAAWMSLPGLDFSTWLSKRRPGPDANGEVIDQTDYTHHKSNSNNNDNKWWQKFSNLRRSSINSKNEIANDPAKALPTHEINKLEVKLSINKKSIKTELVRSPALPRRVLSVRRQVSREVQTRALVSDVADYYENYVKINNLDRFFRNNTNVTSIKPLPFSSQSKNDRWLVKGMQPNGQPFMYTCRNVVLANGATDLSNRLDVSGEDSNEWIKHDLPALEMALTEIPDTKRTGLCLFYFNFV